MGDAPAIALAHDGAEAVLDRGGVVDLVQVVEVDPVCAQPPQALLDLTRDRLRPAVVVAALRRDDEIVGPAGSQRGADRGLALAPGVQVRRVDVPDAGVDGLADERRVIVGVP